MTSRRRTVATVLTLGIAPLALAGIGAAPAVAGQSVRAQSSARYLARFAEQSLPSGMSAWCCPSALAMLTSFQS